MKKNIVKLNETQLKKIVAECIEEAVLDKVNTIGKELQMFLSSISHMLWKKYGQDSNPTKRDYLIAKHFYELGKNSNVPPLD